ncbi:MAG: outer membrane lipoprotein carrier protein LolA [Nitrospirae bacterium]|nr:outer membrane lipoprotein carrier protein LolA [Nitrospirota bacterium]
MKNKLSVVGCQLSKYKNSSVFIDFFFAVIFTVICHLSSVGSVAYAATVEETVSMIEQKAGAIRDITGNFSQESFLVDLERTEKFSGQFFIKKPLMIRWGYAEPRDEEVYIKTDEIWIYKRLAKQAIKSKFSENAYGQAPIALLASIENLRANFEIAATDKENILKLKPKRKIGSIKELLIDVSSGDFPVNSFTIFDIYGNNVIISISDLRINTSILDNVFNFTPAPDMEVFEY